MSLVEIHLWWSFLQVNKVLLTTKLPTVDQFQWFCVSSEYLNRSDLNLIQTLREDKAILYSKKTEVRSPGKLLPLQHMSRTNGNSTVGRVDIYFQLMMKEFEEDLVFLLLNNKKCYFANLLWRDRHCFQQTFENVEPLLSSRSALSPRQHSHQETPVCLPCLVGAQKLCSHSTTYLNIFIRTVVTVVKIFSNSLIRLHLSRAVEAKWYRSSSAVFLHEHTQRVLTNHTMLDPYHCKKKVLPGAHAKKEFLRMV